MSSFALHQFAPVRSYDDLSKQPGHISRFSPVEDKVVAVLYHYNFNVACQCGIQGCGKWHNDGYVVQLESHLISQIGNTCWATKFQEIGEIVNRYTEEQERPRLVDALKRHKAAAVSHRSFLEGMRLELTTLAAKKTSFRSRYPRLYAELRDRSDLGGRYVVKKVVEELKDSAKEKPEHLLRADDFKYREEILGSVRGCEFLKVSALPLLSLAQEKIEMVERTNLVDISFSRLHSATLDGAAIDELLVQAQALLSAGTQLFSTGSTEAIRLIQPSEAVRAEARKFDPAQLDSSMPRSQLPTPRKLTRAERRRGNVSARR
jgi:hypothetical protein